MQILGIDLFYVLLIIGAIVIFLMLREFNCWYWKINQRLALLEEILARLERLEGQPPPPRHQRRFPEISIE
ncbi:hypothetical protein [Desulfobacca acetoxidans]|uniref:Uncharacterized protein n=1 Tax=Desulfobacca acetoxidans (strain ATCC 700848 / DSM 11109 / ASRB2) TaxID=880072 RepID=F2NGE2_DESAR|nr:hypothetical protein [Desulfobacca acetoxidans]AEB08555.1 hypothetical protein Desac_0673 [Desulfobacca acetoxidans DSM 11109]HAY22984.1 hypothetical protein [Desulfobacterales bacterium]